MYIFFSFAKNKILGYYKKSTRLYFVLKRQYKENVSPKGVENGGYFVQGYLYRKPGIRMTKLDRWLIAIPNINIKYKPV